MAPNKADNVTNHKPEEGIGHWKTFGSYVFDPNRIKDDASMVNKVFLTESQTGKCITFDQFVRQSHSLARAMLTLMSFGPNDICVIMSESSIHYAVVIGACLVLNVTYTSVAPAFGPLQLANQLINTEARYLFISKELYWKAQKMFSNEMYKHLKDKIKIVLLDNNSNSSDYVDADMDIEKLATAFQGDQHRINPIPYYDESMNDLVTIVYTSGSTGKPKGTCHTHRSILNSAIHASRNKILAKYSKENMLLSFPLGHISGNSVLFLAIVARTPIVLLNFKHMENMFNVIQKYNIGQIFGATNLVNHLVKEKQPDHDISSLKFVLTAGSRLPTSTSQVLVNQYGITVVDQYGSTECLFISSSDGCSIPDNVGKPLGCLKIKIMPLDNDKQKMITDNQIGEICIKGASRFKEYFRNPEETKRVIDDEGWFHTGDIGYFDEKGNLHITDRMKELIKFKGYSVFPADIESFMMTHPAVSSVVVVPVKHSAYYQVPRAYVQLKIGHSVTPEQLHKYVNENMGIHQRLPGGIIILDQLKYTSMGKIDRVHFKNLCSNELLHLKIKD